MGFLAYDGCNGHRIYGNQQGWTMTDWSRRDVLTAVAGGLATAELPRAASGAAAPDKAVVPDQTAVPDKNVSQHPMRIRTITAGVALSGLDDVGAIERALGRLSRVRQRMKNAGYEVQTIRVAMTPLVASMDAGQRRTALSALEKIDAAIAAADALLSIGPVLTADRVDPELGTWAAELVRRTQRASFSVAVSSAEHGVQRQAIRSAALVIDELSRVDASGTANFRFAAAASIPAGTPFFPAGYHQGPDSLAIGLESAGLVQTALESAADPENAATRLRQVMETQLGPVDVLGAQLADAEGVQYLGIDTSPAPGMDRSIGAAIESLTRRPFGQIATLQACATITAVLKTLSVRSCGYCGLMLPVLEDPVLAKRAQERRYGIQELLLYSTVCGTGLDVVPIPGNTDVEAIARVIADVAALAFRLRKPLSARLFPVPGKVAGDIVRFDDPRLTECRVFEVD
jgi:hypothetical protein